jgi:hypothetical protein
MEIIIDSPDFNYLNFGGVELSSITYTFDVDTQSTLYWFIKSRLRYKPYKITILCEPTIKELEDMILKIKTDKNVLGNEKTLSNILKELKK